MMQKVPKFIRYIIVVPLYLLLLIKWCISAFFWYVFWPLEIIWIIISGLRNSKKEIVKEEKERFPITFLWLITLEKLKLKEVDYSEENIINKEQFD